MSTRLTDKIKKAVAGKEHIIWDWNGTLLQDVDHAVTVVNSLLTEHELPLINRQQYQDIFCFPVLDYYRALGFDFTKESFSSLCERFVERFMAGVPELALFPEMKAVVMDLQAAKVTQSVLSATDQSNLDIMMRHYGLSGVFAFTYGIDNKLAGSKVARGHELIKVSRTSRDKTVMVGDTLHDLEVAAELGVEAVLLAHGHQSAVRLRQKHHLVIEVD